MIRSLRISNFALIDELDLHLEPGFTVITGETGSGKSILLSALDLLTGERADFSLIGPKGEKAFVEANIWLKGYALESFFQLNDLDYSEEVILRRELISGGRSRSFINDTPVQLTVLRELAYRLITINSQFNTLELKDKEYQLELLDAMSGLLEERRSYSNAYKIYREKLIELDRSEQELNRLFREKDFNIFHLNELESLDLYNNDFSQLEKELNVAENSEQIIQSLAFFISGLNREAGLLEFLGKVRSDLDKIRGYDEALNEFYTRTDTLFVEMKDLLRDVESYSESVELDPKLKAALTEKLDKFNLALRKHNAKEQEGLIGVLETLSAQVSDTEKLEAEIILLKAEVADACGKMEEIAHGLHKRRLEESSVIGERMSDLLSELKLENTLFRFELSEKSDFGQSGKTHVNIMFSANKGIEPVPIEKAASGGELSRVMLALQKLVSEKKAMPTVIFDEIDTGVSGYVAQKIGNMLKRMGSDMQLLAISHLPQVAARAAQHVKVEKVDENGRAVSRVYVLTSAEQIEEIARLMSGEQVTAAALENARDLINA